jgi:hypothetical protein
LELVLLEKEELVVKAGDFIGKERWEGFAKRCYQHSVFQTVEFALATNNMSRALDLE